MKKYEKPVVILNDGFAEGVYAASGGDEGAECYTITARITQKPETGRENYCIQVDALHGADHHSTGQTFVITFNQPVQFVSCYAQGASLAGGDGTNRLKIDLSYHNNFSENIGFGDLYVTSETGLEIISVEMTKCVHSQHT